MGKILETTLHGQKIGFHPQRVLLLPDLDAMLVADIHLGKAEFMQGKGIPSAISLTKRIMNAW